MEPRPAGCPDPEPTPPVVPLPLAGLGDVPKTVAATALREVADTSKVQLAGLPSAEHPRPGRLAIQGLQLRMSTATKIANVTPSGSGDSIAYSFGLYNPALRNNSAFSVGLAQTSAHAFENEIFSLKTNDASTSVSVERVESIASQLGEDWDYSILKAASVPSVKDGAKDSTLYAELWTDYASAGKNDYMVAGWWLLAPNNPAGDYRFGVLAKGEKYYINSVKPGIEGPATYKGPAAGLYTSSEDGIQRLLGKVTLTADFGTTASSSFGTIKGEIRNLTLDGESVRGEILLPKATLGIPWYIAPIIPSNTNLNPKSDIGNIEGINYRGDWVGTFQGDSSGNDQPTGIVGVVGGSGGGNSFVASFGARKVEEEQ